MKKVSLIVCRGSPNTVDSFAGAPVVNCLVVNRNNVDCSFAGSFNRT